MTAALEGDEWSAARPGRTLPTGKTRYPLYRKMGGPQGRSGQGENLVPIGIRSRTVQPVAQSLYRLSYPAHKYQAISSWLLTAEARVKSPIIHLGFVINNLTLKQFILRIFRVSSVNYHFIAFHIHSPFIWRTNNVPNRGRFF